MEWKELKWYKADEDYSFFFSKCLVIAKNGEVVISDHADKDEYYIPLPLIEDLPKD